jgi:uncharacterized protein
LQVGGLALPEFSPRLPWWGGDLQTVRNYLRNRLPQLPDQTSERLLLPLDDGSGDQLVATLHRPEVDAGKPLIVLIHGLGGCEASCYLVMAASYLLQRGYPVLRLNLRGAGPSRPYCRLQYHAGATAELHAALMRLDPTLRRGGVLAVGFSLGGNVLLKYLAEYAGEAPVAAAASVSAPIDLAAASRCLQRWRNALYQRYLLAGIKRNCTAAAADLTARERAAILAAQSVYQFDDSFTAPRSGYRGADHYYEANAAKRFLDAIRIPTLLDTPAAVRWLSCEPLLGPVDLRWCDGVDAISQDWTGGPGGGMGAPHPFIDWCVVGGESGPGARPMELDWARSLVRQCQDAGTAVFVKQLGIRWGKEHHNIGRFPEDLRVRQFPAEPVQAEAAR